LAALRAVPGLRVDSGGAPVLAFGAMEFAEALLALGVSGASEWEALSAEALKRAYLKKVRAHPPERDPEGFQRVREAYELLRALAPVQTAIRQRAPSTPSAAMSAESPPPVAQPESDETERASRARKAEPDNTGFARLQQALSQQQHDTAADVMIELYASAPRASPRPPPQLVLSVITKQFIGGSQERGRRLFLAFEEDMARMNAPLSARLAAVWKLLAELVVLSDKVPPAVTRALAGAIESGDFQEATEVLREEINGDGRQRRPELESTLQTIAPTLCEAARSSNGGASLRYSRIVEGWAGHLVLLLFVVGSWFSHDMMETAALRRTRLSQTGEASASNTARSPKPASRGDQTNSGTAHGALCVEQAKDFDFVTSKLEKVLRFSRCEQLRAAWEDYASVVRRLKSCESVVPQYEAHRALAITTCRHLAGELSESL